MYNINSRKKNAALSSMSGVFEQIVVYGLSFVYRTVFLMVLSKNYLGISGLFTSVLQLFSLAELGIGGVIIYRMYLPIKNNNKEKCAALLEFYRKFYNFLIVFVLFMGVCFYPFLSHIIKDTSEIPADINLGFVYWLFVIQSAISYFGVYVQSLLSADQKNYIISLANTIYHIVANVLKILVLFVTMDFTLTLVMGILTNACYNVIFAQWIKKRYKDIVSINAYISKSEKALIYKDTWAMLCHKIGYVILNSTDSIILSKYIGVVVVGIYSNYAFIAVALDTIMNKLLGSFTPTIGNIMLDDKVEKHNLYKNLKFINLWIASFCAITFFVVANPFMTVWLDESYKLSMFIVAVISLNMFLNSSRIINNVYVNASGLFVKDKIRPLIQAIINLIVSIILAKKMGIAGVFIGTLVSCLVTSWWREPFILYKKLFHEKVKEYFVDYFTWLILTIVLALTLVQLCKFIPVSVTGIVSRILTCGIVINGSYLMIFYKTKEMMYLRSIIKNLVNGKR